ncbi:DUF1398 domain-containing protein [Janthinobacterium sp. B9-8]|uniref:DUF1398 domain-containing protein n=1 Tax=Janthinobacterium sp. B9-8 TaxID=1236179 RepID=UPI00061D2FDE|nr:DUF1398 family protein [Janthinobacterium sp. B9-8]AMC34433.1 hypothetical protein VN23_07370 [Janthinobacterium sp. B9-8]
MSNAIKNIESAMQYAASIRPKVAGFPYLAEVLRQAGVTRNTWALPACQSIFTTNLGPVVMQGTPLLSGATDIPPFNEAALISALRIDQAGESTFPEFLNATWLAGVVRYDVDLLARTCTYYGAADEAYIESYPAITL